MDENCLSTLLPEVLCEIFIQDLLRDPIRILALIRSEFLKVSIVVHVSIFSRIGVPFPVRQNHALEKIIRGSAELVFDTSDNVNVEGGLVFPL